MPRFNEHTRSSQVSVKKTSSEQSNIPEFLKYKALQDETRNLIKELHRPLFDALFGLVLGPKIMAYFKNLLSIDTFREEISKAVDGEIDSGLSVLLAEIKKNINECLVNRYPLEEWSKHISGTKEVKRLIGVLLEKLKSLYLYCSGVFSKILIASYINNDITAEIDEELDVCNNVIDTYRSLTKAIGKFEKNHNLLEEISDEAARKIFDFLKKYGIFAEAKDDIINEALGMTDYFILACLSIPFARKFQNILLNRISYGIFHYRFKNSGYLLEPQYGPINPRILNNNIKSLQAIHDQLVPWRDMVRWITLLVFLMSVVILFVKYFSSNLSVIETGLFILIEPLLINYVMQGGVEHIISYWNKTKNIRDIKYNENLLKLMSDELGLPKWNLNKSSNLCDSFFYINLHDKIKIDKQSVSKKALRSTIINVFSDNGIRIKYFDNIMLVIAASAKFPADFKNKIIERIKNQSIVIYKRDKDQKLLQNQIELIANRLFGSRHQYYKLSNDSEDNIDYYLVLNNFELNITNHIFNVLSNIYNNDNVSIIDSTLGVSIKISAEHPSKNNLFNNQLALLSNLTVQNDYFDKIMDEKQGSIVASRKKKKLEKNLFLQERSLLSSKPVVQFAIQFGKWGSYDPNKQNNSIQPMVAPFWSKPNHFMVFCASRHSFKTDEEYNNFATMCPHIVPKKGAKGIVGSKKKDIIFPDGKKRTAKYKLKDPKYDTRVYAHSEIFKGPDSNKVTLHVFDGVVLNAHKKYSR